MARTKDEILIIQHFFWHIFFKSMDKKLEPTLQVSQFLGFFGKLDSI